MKKILPVISRRSTIGLVFGASVFSLGLGGCNKSKVQEGVMRVALAGGPDSLDPFKAEFAASALLFRQYLLPIVGYGKNSEPAPAIAQSWSASDDYKIWTFAIKPDLKWSDGEPLTQADILKSFQMGCDPKVAYPDAQELFAIKNYSEALLNGKSPQEIGVKFNDNNLIIELEGPDANFAQRMQEFYPVPIHAIDKYGSQWTEMGKIVVSGPFKPILRETTRLVFEKNPNGGWVEGMAQRIEVETVDDASTRVRMFQSGDIDLSQDPPALRFKDLANEFGPSFERTPAPRFFYMSLNTKKPQLADMDIRRALALAIDRDFIAQIIMREAVHPATRYMRNQPPIQRNIEEAKKILEQKGYNAANPLRFELVTTKDERERAAVQIADSWKQIGVEAIIGTMDSSAISTRLNGHDFDAAIVRLDKGMKSDPLDLMASFATGGNAYSHGWKNAQFDNALEAAFAVPIGEARTQATLKAEEFMLKETPIIPLWFADSAWLRGSRISGGLEGVPSILWGELRLKEANTNSDH